MLSILLGKGPTKIANHKEDTMNQGFMFEIVNNTPYSISIGGDTADQHDNCFNNFVPANLIGDLGNKILTPGILPSGKRTNGSYYEVSGHCNNAALNITYTLAGVSGMARVIFNKPQTITLNNPTTIPVNNNKNQIKVSIESDTTTSGSYVWGFGHLIFSYQ
jgi:hypothetical protein